MFMDIKETWKEHPLYKQGKIELIPTDWMWRYWGPDVSPNADLMDGTIVTLDELMRLARKSYAINIKLAEAKRKKKT